MIPLLLRLVLASRIVLAADTFNANFGSSPAPFQIDVKPEFIQATKDKVSLTRYTEDFDQPDFVEGPPKHNVTTVRDYWVNSYCWEDVQSQLNKKLEYLSEDSWIQLLISQ